jgi:hypothetical protein
MGEQLFQFSWACLFGVLYLLENNLRRNKSTLKKRVAIFALAFILGGIHTVSAETGKRVQFAKGKSSAVIKGVTGEYGVTYH